MSESDEFTAARATLDLAGRVSRSFIRQLGALAPILIIPIPGAAMLGRRPDFVATVIDDKYWFSKLYELMTFFEIRDRANFENPGFVMHFIPVFYGMYFDALQNFARGGRSKVSQLWLTHFDGLRDGGNPVEPGTMEGVKHSIKTGVTAHIQGDMANGLESAYRSWDANPKPPFEALKRDFFEKNRPTFEAGRAAFFIDLNDKMPSPFRPEVGQMIIAMGEGVVGGGISVDEVYKWRDVAWATAASRLKAGAAAGGN